MGGQYSDLPKPPDDFPYCLIYFCYDSLYMAFANDQVVETIRRAILQHWSKGIQAESSSEYGCYYFKMHGTPFAEGGSTESALQTQRMCCKMLSDLNAKGWTLSASSDLSRTPGNSTLFFQQSSIENKHTQMVCVSFSNFNGLHLVGAPDHLKPIFKEAAVQGYASGIEKERLIGADYELKLRGQPWSGENSETGSQAKRMLLEIFRKFDQVGFQYYGTANLRGTTDCIFFIGDERYPPGQHKFAVVSLNQTDTLRLIECPSNLIDCTKNLVQQYWRHGLREQNDLRNGIYEFTFNGSPWWATEEDAVSARFFISMMFQKYMSLGWCLVTSLDICTRKSDKSIFIFKSCQPKTIIHFCLSLNQVDKIRLINAPRDMVDVISQAVAEGWPPGIKFEGAFIGSHQIKLQGDAWGGGTGNEWLLARCMMAFVLKALTERGWRVVCSADVSAKYHQNSDKWVYPLDVHSWFIAYSGNAEAATVGTPVQTQEFSILSPAGSS